MHPKFEYVYKGEKKSLPKWAKEYKIPINTLYARVNKLGWAMHKALTTPVRPKAAKQ